MTSPSHAAQSAGEVFRRPGEFALFEAVRRLVEALGPVQMRVSKTQVSFARARQFAWAWPPAVASKKRPEQYIILSFSLARRVEDRRIVESVEPRPGRWTHHVIIEQERDLDPYVEAWLREAWDLAALTGRSRRASPPRGSI